MDRDIYSEFLFYCAVERRLSANTQDAYECDLSDFRKFSGTRTIDEALSVENLKSYLSNLVQVRSLSASTIRRRIACLRAFSRFVFTEIGLSDPFKEWSPQIKRPKRLPRALSSPEVCDLVADDPDYSSIDDDTILCVLVLGATGLRVSELCGINLRDLTKDGSAIHVKGKGSRDRIAYVGNEQIRGRLSELRKARLKHSDLNEPLLLNSRHRRLQPQTLRRRLHALTEKQGLERRVTPHMLRHTAATLLIEGGTDIRFVQRLLGHASISTTEIYTRVTDTALQKAVNDADPMARLMTA